MHDSEQIWASSSRISTITITYSMIDLEARTSRPRAKAIKYSNNICFTIPLNSFPSAHLTLTSPTKEEALIFTSRYILTSASPASHSPASHIYQHASDISYAVFLLPHSDYMNTMQSSLGCNARGFAFSSCERPDNISARLDEIPFRVLLGNNNFINIPSTSAPPLTIYRHKY